MADTIGLVYFIAAEQVGRVKIGWTEHNPRFRMDVLQAGSPVKLTLLGTIQGTLDDEKWFHRRFAEHRWEREWFELVPALRAEIEILTAEVFPLPSRTPLAQAGPVTLKGAFDTDRGIHSRAKRCDFCQGNLHRDLFYRYESADGESYYACVNCTLDMNEGSFVFREELNTGGVLVCA